MKNARTVSPPTAYLLLLVLFLAVPAWGQGFSPVQEQEYLDARQAFEQARSAQADQYAAEALKTSSDWLAAAEKARTTKDAALFMQASRLARAHAELAEATAGLKKEQEALMAADDTLKKIKAEIDRLQKMQ